MFGGGLGWFGGGLGGLGGLGCFGMVWGVSMDPISNGAVFGSDD